MMERTSGRLLDESALARIRVGLDGWRSRLDNVQSLLAPKPCPPEWSVLRAILDRPDERYRRLQAQLESAEYIIRRRPSASSFALILPAARLDLVFPLDASVASAPLLAADLATATPLVFRGFVDRGGIFSHLEGVTADGRRWPRRWSVEPSRSPAPASPLLVLPPLDQVRARERAQRIALAGWLGREMSMIEAADLRLGPMADPAAVDSFAAREQVDLPSQYRALLEITDGLGIGELDLLGSRDAHRLDIPDTDRLVIARVHGERDDSVLTVARHGRDETVSRMDIHDRELRSHPVAVDVRALVADVLDRGIDPVVDAPRDL